MAELTTKELLKKIAGSGADTQLTAAQYQKLQELVEAGVIKDPNTLQTLAEVARDDLSTRRGGRFGSGGSTARRALEEMAKTPAPKAPPLKK